MLSARQRRQNEQVYPWCPCGLNLPISLRVTQDAGRGGQGKGESHESLNLSRDFFTSARVCTHEFKHSLSRKEKVTLQAECGRERPQSPCLGSFKTHFPLYPPDNLSPRVFCTQMLRPSYNKTLLTCWGREGSRTTLSKSLGSLVLRLDPKQLAAPRPHPHPSPITLSCQETRDLCQMGTHTAVVSRPVYHGLIVG